MPLSKRTETREVAPQKRPTPTAQTTRNDGACTGGARRTHGPNDQKRKRMHRKCAPPRGKSDSARPNGEKPTKMTNT